MLVASSFNHIPRPNARGTHMSGPDPHPNMPIKEMSSDEGQRKEIY
jgi:hypothetical protein